jgi:hypothetical protein
MRKHFLLLMLLSLLPMLGFAADLNKGTIVVQSCYFGQTPAKGAVKVFDEGGAELTVNTDYTFDGYFSDAECTVSADDAAIKAANAGTPFYAKVTGIKGYEGNLIGSFEIKKMPLTITLVAAYEKDFGTKDPAFVINKVIDADEVDKTAALKSSITMSRKPGENAGKYDYTATITGQPNYIFDKVNDQFTINPKTFVNSGKEGTDVFAKVTGTYTYTGSKQTPTVVVKDGDKVLEMGTAKNPKDYMVVCNSINAGKGAGTVTLTGQGNYSADNIVLNFDIAAAPLLVTPSATKTYDGTVDLSKVTYTYQGFVDAKTADDVTVGGSACTVTSPSVNVGTYKLNITTNDFAMKAEPNYEFLPVEGTFEITKKDLNVEAEDKELDYGAEEIFTVTYTDGFAADPNKTDEQAIKDAIKVSKVDPDKNGKNLLPVYKTDDEIGAAIDALKLDEKVAAARKAAAIAAKGNYNLKATRGKLTYKNASLKIALKESAYTLTRVYDGKKVSESITLDKENGLTIIGKKNESDVINTENLKLEVVGDAATPGTYTLKLSGATADKYDITYIPSKYTINKRPIQVMVYDQIFVKGTVLNLNTTLFDIIEEKDKEGNYVYYPLADGDKASEIFALQTNIAVDGDGKITSDEAGNPFKITVEDAGKKTPKYAYYDFDVKGVVYEGVATVVNEALTLDDTKSLVNAAGKDKDEAKVVVFSSRALNTEQWNVLVLPFEIDVKALALAFGYAVIDVLDQSANDGNVHFKIQVNGTIPANTPFLIYPSDTYNNLNQITLIGNIKKGAMSKATVEVKDQSNNKFVGTYATTGIYGEPFRYLSKGTWYDARNYDKTTPCNIKPLRGYLDLSANINTSAPVIYIEEPNGEVTAINSITAERIAVEKDGWFTLNGMKLQGAPTEKGIYIRNGKKVVIK